MPLHTILVAYDGSAQADDLLCLACDVVAAEGTVVALYVTRVPSSLPIAPLPAHVDAAGRAALDHAERVMRRYDGVIELQHMRAHRVDDAIVEAAVALDADAIFLPLPAGRLWQRWRWARLAWVVRRRAPCRVLLSYQPAVSLGRTPTATDTTPDGHVEPRLLRRLP